MSGRNWTEEELAVLRAEYRRGRCKDLATRLGRTWRAVAQKAEKLGLVRRNERRPAWTAELEARYRDLHAQGKSDAEIARLWGKESVLRAWLSQHRRRLGLPSNRSKNPHYSGVMRERLRQQLAAAGHETLDDYRRERCREVARAYGLPEHLQPRCVQIALVLVSGPKTKSQICAAIGLTFNPTKKNPTNCLNAGAGRSTYLSQLVKAGLVVRQRIPGSGGKGPSVRGVEQSRYMLTPFALSLLSSIPTGEPDRDTA